MLEAGGGAIVNISSVMGRVSGRGYLAYGAAKAALAHYTRLAARDLAPRIRINAIAVGSVATSALEFVVQDDKTRKAMEDATPLHAIGDADDVAAAVIYLASPASAYVTGKVLEVDGGPISPTLIWVCPTSNARVAAVFAAIAARESFAGEIQLPQPAKLHVRDRRAAIIAAIMNRRRQTSLVLATLQAGDLFVTLVSPKYGDAHLDHLGVPPWLRPLLPTIKLAAVVSLVVTSNRPRTRSMTGAALVAYYSAAVTFHALSGDSPTDAVPAAAFGAFAGTIV